MSNETAKPLARTADLVTKEVADEVLVYDLKTHQAHCLNQTAALVWKYCDGATSVVEMTALMKRDFNPAIDEAAVWHAIERLGKVSLLETKLVSPAGIPRLGRRDAMRRLGLGSAIAVPVVMSILAPTVLAGCTFGNAQPVGQPCCTNANCTSNCCAKDTSASTDFTCQPTTGSPANSPCTAACQCTSSSCTTGKCD